jgi:hypothetical protein
MSTNHPTTSAPSREPAIILTRTSDPKQSGGSSQLTNCRRLGAQHDVLVVAEVDDEGVSGDDLEREGIIETLALLQQEHKAGRPVRWLITDQSDRLSRADSIDTSEVLAKMRRLGIRKVATPVRVFDLYNALDRTLLQIEADHKNNPYLKDLGRRVLNGMLDAARGGFWTGQKAPLGYKIVHAPGDHGSKRRKSGRLVVDEETAPIVRDLFRRYLDGASTYDLTGWLGLKTGRRWTQAGVSKLLRRELYIGIRKFGETTAGRHARLQDGVATLLTEGLEVKGDVVRLSGYPAILTAPDGSPDVETFAAVGARLATGRRRSQQKGKALLPLSGLCRCGACGLPLGEPGEPMYCTTMHGAPYLTCKNRKQRRYDLCPSSRYVRGDVVLRRVLALLAERFLEGDAVARLVELAGKAEGEAKTRWEADQAAAQRALEAADKRLTTARRRMADEADEDILEEYRILLRELKEEKAAAEAELARLRGEQPRAEEGDGEMLERWLEMCRGACTGAALAEEDGPTANAVLKKLVACVVVHPPRRTADGPKRLRGERSVGRVEVVLPEWISGLLATTARLGCQQAARIVLVCDPA